MLVCEKFQAGAGPLCYCVLPSHPHSWKSSLKSLLVTLPQCPVEQEGSWWARVALDASPAGHRKAAQPPSHSHIRLSPSPQLWLWDQVQSSRALAGPQGMSGIITPSPPEKQASRFHCLLRKQPKVVSTNIGQQSLLSVFLTLFKTVSQVYNRPGQTASSDMKTFS